VREDTSKRLPHFKVGKELKEKVNIKKEEAEKAIL